MAGPASAQRNFATDDIIVSKASPGEVTGPGADSINAWVREVWNEVGDMADYRIFPTDLIVAFWNPKTVGSSGKILSAPQTQRENRYQAKCGLVLHLGSQAFVSDDKTEFHGFCAKVGDWVVFNYNDGREIGISKPGKMGTLVGKVLKDGEISMIIPRPDRVW